MQNYDLNGNGYFDYGEFMAAALKQTVICEESRLKEAFEQFDENHDGSISPNELKSALEKLDDQSMSDDRINELLNKVDTNHDGKISLSEFTAMMCKEMQL